MSLWSKLNGSATHTRAVYYQKGHWWVVIDVIETDRPRTVEAFWHAHPNSSVTADAVISYVSGVPTGQMAVITMNNSKWTVSLAQGQQPPEYEYYQGWYSASYLDCQPSPTLVYTTKIAAKTTVFGWLLLPSPKVQRVDAQLSLLGTTAKTATISVTLDGKEQRVVIPFA
jgi:hypothetical protein